MDFQPVIFSEDKASVEEADNYRQCEVCTEKSRIIWGEGNPEAAIFVILDNPGEREDKEGMEYICGTRQTLQAAIFQAGLPVDNVYVTYLLKCRPLRRYDKEVARAFSKPFLLKQINQIQPKYLVCLGDIVVQTMFDNNEAHVKNMRGRWHTLIGYPAIISYHPLAVRRRPNLMCQFQEDWDMLALSFLSGK